MAETQTSWRKTYFSLTAGPFWAVHAAAVIGVATTGFSWSGLALALALYYARMFFITAGYHRYFAHRSYKTSRWFQFVLAVGGATSAQKGPLWWAGHHRDHHRYSDTERDLHSPRQRGFWWSHIGWILCADYNDIPMERIRDMAKYPELRFLDRFPNLVAIVFATLLFVFGGFETLVWGFFVLTVLLWHGTFTINSLSHVFGRAPYDTGDDSRNNWILALVTMGEGWHNNHHHYMNSARQGFRWYELDLSFVVLRVLAAVGLVSDLRPVPKHIQARPGQAGGADRAVPPMKQLPSV